MLRQKLAEEAKRRVNDAHATAHEVKEDAKVTGRRTLDAARRATGLPPTVPTLEPDVARSPQQRAGHAARRAAEIAAEGAEVAVHAATAPVRAARGLLDRRDVGEHAAPEGEHTGDAPADPDADGSGTEPADSAEVVDLGDGYGTGRTERIRTAAHDTVNVAKRAAGHLGLPGSRGPVSIGDE